MQLLQRIRVRNWKSISEADLRLQPLNVIVGANGAGKSNLLSLFRLINATFSRRSGLSQYVGEAGGANDLLHLGAKHSPTAELELAFDTDTGRTDYAATWAAASRNSLIYTSEVVRFAREGRAQPQEVDLGAGHPDSRLEDAAADDATAQVCLKLLRSCRLYHFHDTSSNSPLRLSTQVGANRWLYPDGGNVAAMLFLYQERHPAVLLRIEATLGQILPNFERFVLSPSPLNEHVIELQWRQHGSDYVFGAHQLSDGTLRFLALATLLMQPPGDFPLLIALDEPEIGLHPAAIGLLAEMIHAASTHCQLVLTSQSVTLLNQFRPEHIITCNLRAGASQFERLPPGELAAWLDDYDLGELWERNILHASPYG